MKRLWMLLVFLLAAPAYATDILARSCLQADVDAAVAQLRSGDRVVAPIGTATWTGISNWVVPANSAIIGACTIVDDLTRSGWDPGLINIATDPVGGFQFSGFTLKGSGRAEALTYNGSLRISGSTKQLRVDHLKVEGLHYTGILFAGQLYGVVDHSTFNLSAGTALRFYAGDWGGKAEGDGAWSEDTGLGTNRFIFVEDSVFKCAPNGGGVQDSYLGSRFVIRYNILENCGLQTHPTGGSGRARGTRAFEIYKNKATVTGAQFNFAFISSGTGVIWGNDVPTGYKHFLTLHSMRVDGKTYPQAPFPGSWGYCPSPFDKDGCFDQPGRGKSDVISGQFPNVRNETKGCLISMTCGVEQVIEPVHEWGNAWSPLPNDANSSKVAVYEPSALLPGRDYKLDTPLPNYTPYRYPHELNTDTPAPPPPPPPPAPTPNEKPQVVITTPAGGQLITVKYFRIKASATDDTGTTRLEVFINDQLWFSTADASIDREWNTAPYRGKGQIEIKVVARDAEGEVAEKSVFVTVRK
jgi:hypothetical protein